MKRSLLRRAKDAVRDVLRRHPPASSRTRYGAKLAAELDRFRDDTDVHALPAIFHYWSNRYLRPKLEAIGASHPDEFFAKFLGQCYERCDGGTRRFISVGAGNCDTEVRLARSLIDAGCRDFTIECLELNDAMLDRGRSLASAEGVAAHVVPLQGDFNSWRPHRRFDAVIANQSLHHVSALEGLFDAVAASLAPHATFVVSDMIGRNGHRRWPEAVAIVREFWRELPAPYRYNQQLRRQETQFLDWDCSTSGFEGIRAQDILPLLVERFDFELFLGFANVIDPFVDRGFGPNFSVESSWDRDFIDRVHARDEAELSAGRVKPTHMFAVMRAGGGCGAPDAAASAARAAIRRPD
ncbi:MAG: class I SAM-dependent methyltransferase [Casimicrobiaceae bacterium]